MQLDPMQGRWLQVKDDVKSRWSHLTPDDLDMVAGMNARLIQKLQERYGCSQEEAERQVEDFLDRLTPVLESRENRA
jgi:uncharacterized protein YjbJ (UPF0337 family)